MPIELPTPYDAFVAFLDAVHRETTDDGTTGRRAAYRMGEAAAESDLTIEETFELLEQEASDVLTVLSADILGSIVRGYVDQVMRTRGLTRRRGTGRLSSHVARLAALYRINRAATATLRLEDVLATIVEVVAETIDGDACSVFLYDSHSQTLILRATKGLNPATVGRLVVRSDSGITGLAASTMRTHAARVAHEHPAFFTYPIVGEDAYTSQVSIPLLLREPDRLVGVMNIQSIEERDFDQDEITFLETVGGELAIAIENARLYSQTDAALHRRIVELHALQSVNRELSGTLLPDELYPLIARKAAEIIGGHAATIYRTPAHQDGPITSVATYETQENADPDATQFPQAVIDEVITTRGTIAVDCSVEAGVSRLTYCAPIMTAHGVLGALCVRVIQDDPHTEDRLSLFQAFADSAALAMENAELFDEATRGYARASTLLQEMHHRVRNNLQTVAALLSMQARHSVEASNHSTLREAVARVQSIAAVHNLLSADNLTEATITSIVKHVVDEASINVVPPGLQVQFNVDGAPVMATSRQATILALLVNECVTNAIEHGMAERTSGTVSITASQVDEMIQVVIEDDGKGVPQGFDVERDSQLGLRIARTLAVSDLGGSFTLEPRPIGGARSIICFPAQR